MARDSPVEDIRSYLNELGVYPKFEWLAECVGHLSNSDLTFSALPASAQAKLCFAQYINSDMNSSGAAILPENVASMHRQQLRGRFILQVDEITDIGVPAKDRYVQTGGAGGGAGRCLKLSITDGAQRVTALEYRRTPAINPTLPAGTKVTLTDVPTRRGLLLLSPELVEVLGGQVAELEAARVRAVTKWNEPPRGRRRAGRAEGASEGSSGRGLGRDAGGPTVAEQSTAAAWPHRNPENPDTRTEHGGTPPGNGSSAGPSVNGRPTGGGSVGPGRGFRGQGDGLRYQNIFPSAAGNGTRRAAPPVQIQREQNVGEGRGPADPSATGEWGVDADDFEFLEGEELPHRREQTVEGFVSDVSIGREKGGVGRGMEGDGGADMEEGSDDDVEIIGSTPAPVPANHRQQEIPTEFCRYPYLSRLVGGGGFRGAQRIKCVVSGIKKFDARRLELVVYLEDGTQICEATVVPHLIGRLLGAPPGMPPAEVAAALAHPDERSRFNPGLRGMQEFLEGFEGVTDVRWGRKDGKLEVIDLVMGAGEGGNALVRRAWDLLESLEGHVGLEN